MLGVCKIMLARSLRAKACPCKDMDFCYFLSKLTYYMLAFARYSGPRNDIDMYVIWRHGLLWNRHYDGCTVLLFVALRHWLNERSTRTFSALPRRMLVVCAVNSSEIVFVASMWQAALARYQQYLWSIVSSNSCYNQGHRGRWSTVGPTFVRILRGIFFMHKGDSLQHICKNWTLWNVVADRAYYQNLRRKPIIGWSIAPNPLQSYGTPRPLFGDGGCPVRLATPSQDPIHGSVCTELHLALQPDVDQNPTNIQRGLA